jgi:hypothetical protein
MDNIEMDLRRKNGWGGKDWIGLAQDSDQLRDQISIAMNL